MNDVEIDTNELCPIEPIRALIERHTEPDHRVTREDDVPVKATVDTLFGLPADPMRESIDASMEMKALERSLALMSVVPDGTIVRANDKFLRLLGYKDGELVGHNQTILLPDSAASRASHAALWASLKVGEFCTQEYQRRRKDGSAIWLRATHAPVLGPDGKVIKVVVFAADISANKLRDADEKGQIAAINTSQAVIHFALDGTIEDANDLFLKIMGYDRDDVVGRHHRIFVAPDYAESDEYAAFWQGLAEGRHQAAEYKRYNKEGREVWLQATYNPIFDMNGKPFKVVKYATDVTLDRLRQADHHGQIAAIHKSQCVISFDMDGTIIEANDRFLEAMGYAREQVEGRHHRMFVDPSYAHGAEYANFWTELTRGQHRSGEYKRVGKDGREVWLQATYNPVYDMNGRLFKVVKYASDVTQEKLRQADHQGQIAAIHKAQCVVSFELDGTIIDANDNFLVLTGYRLTDVRRKHHSMFVEPTQAASATYAAFWSDLAKGQYRADEFKRVGRDGREIWLQATYNPIFDINGRPFKVVKYAIDVTQEKLRKADSEGQIAAIHKSQCVIAFDMDGIILDANDNFLSALGYKLSEIKGCHHRIFVEADFAASDEYAEFWKTLRAGAFHSAMYKRLGKDGREVWIQASYNPIFDLNGLPFKIVKFATDVSADIALAEALSLAKQQAQHDAATALPNRLRLASFMTSALSETGARLAVLYLDLDRFKPINDTHGHHVGDRVLGEIANRLRRALPEDQLVARVGGDEFVVVAPGLSTNDIEKLCIRLIALVTAPILHEDKELTVGLSVGVAVSPGDATTADDLLRCADVALYRSKGAGRGTYSFYAQDVNDRIVAGRHMAEEMRSGLTAKEFFLEFQPRFNARTTTIQSVEALVRWNHPERGRVEPMEFIPLAEANNLIVPLGEWVLRTACQAAIAWPGIGVSVNVSPVQFRAGELVELVKSVLEETGLQAERLELEITEGVLLEDEERALLALNGLKSLGVKLAMDDFGTGYSSLSYLRSFPFDVIKIDRRFIADIEKREGGRSIVQAILGLGKALGISVTAEGVETPGQLLMLTLDECSEVQGFLLARPMSAEALTQMLADDDHDLFAEAV